MIELGAATRIQTLVLPELTAADVVVPAGDLWRIILIDHPHATEWNEFRAYGPVPGCRFDPQTPPAHAESHNSVTYCSEALETAILEVFWRRQTIDRLTGTPVVYRFSLQEPITVLDLRPGWASRTAPFQAVNQLPVGASQLLARRLRAGYPHLAGLRYPSFRDGYGSNLALWAPAQSALASATLVEAAPLADRRFDRIVATVGNEHGLY